MKGMAFEYRKSERKDMGLQITRRRKGGKKVFFLRRLGSFSRTNCSFDRKNFERQETVPFSKMKIAQRKEKRECFIFCI